MKNMWGEVFFMKRNVDMNQISDGKLYGINDMVKAGCDGCNGCSACCSGMGKSVVLDPLDVYRMTENLGKTFEELLAGNVELNVVDGIILPNLKMSGSEERCSFLDNNGRCRIHGFRPGICRLFPLGRYYENGSYKYFLQVNECSNKSRAKIKVAKWLDTPNIKDYEKYINDWHYFTLDVQKRLVELKDSAAIKDINMYILNTFYVMPFTDEKFYEQFYNRLANAKAKAGLA